MTGSKATNTFKLGVFMMMALTIVVSGCSSDSGSSEGTSTPAPTNQPASQTPSTDEGILEDRTISKFLLSNPTWPYDEQWPIWSMIKEQTGYDVSVQVSAGNYDEALNLIIAANSTPDLLYMPDIATANRFGQQGALVNLLDHLDVMPNFTQWMEQHPEAVEAARAADGNIYIAPVEGIGEANRDVWYYRKDIFDKHGLEVPKDYDEMYEVLKELKRLYPESYPFTSRRWFIPLGQMVTAFGAPAKITADVEPVYYDFDEQTFNYGPITEGYKKMVEYASKFYAEGLIPPDFLTMDNKQWQDIYASDKAFITPDKIGRIDFLNSAMREGNPEFDIQFMPPPAGEAGGEQISPFTAQAEASLSVSTRTKQVENAMEYLDFFYSEKGMLLSSWGAEGVSYETVNGEKRFLPDYKTVSDIRMKLGLATPGVSTWIDNEAHVSLSSEETKIAYTEAPSYDAPRQPTVPFTETENEEVALLEQTIKKYSDEQIARFILNEKDLSEWDSYVEEVRAMGVDRLLDYYTSAYERMQH
ncbi:extracellular solute-binding protein [Paenibacillus sp. 1P07SE]|uniref:extracellular solute-binding protein n=1 Tax=Paenibacillus sp. 1P07SE TaxID=3132209 RepID=UPI0039A73DC0